MHRWLCELPSWLYLELQTYLSNQVKLALSPMGVISNDFLFPGLDFERASYEHLLPSKDRMEALQAFKEKRAPVWLGE